MKQILHIFQKDTRRFWPEILLSVVVILAFAVQYPIEWRRFDDLPDRQRMLGLLSALGTLMVAGWGFLVARIIHAEPLVGDRQFWITRPYKWKKLLAAKVLFLAVWIGVPYLVAQSIILAEAGFHPPAYVLGLLGNLLVMSAIFLLPVFALAAVTTNFARLTLTVMGSGAVLLGYTYFINGASNAYTPSIPYTNPFLFPLLFAGCAVAITLQYATRRVWLTRALLIVVSLLIAVSVSAYRRQSLVDRAYPQPSASATAPITVSHTPNKYGPDDARTWDGENYIDLPVNFSGVAEGWAVFANDFKFTITAADGSQWISPWQEFHERARAGDNYSKLSLPISPALYERFKSAPVTLRITFAVTRYQAESVTSGTYPAGDAAVPGVGFCAQESRSSYLFCRSALRQPSLAYATTVWSSVSCSETAPPEATTRGGGWIEPNRDPNFGTSPVWIYGWLFNRDDEEYGRHARWHICPGSPLEVTQYHLVDRTRTDLTLPNFTLPARVVNTGG
jgi:hypothetical protein